MNILAFDTCFDSCSACVAEQRGGVVIELAETFERFQTGHAQRLIPMVGEVLQLARMSFDQIDRIAVTAGPGTFTGTRIGIAAARAFALACGAKTVGVSSLVAMAEAARTQVTAEALAVVVDARRGEFYAQLFGPGGGLDAKTPPQVLSIEDAARQGSGPIVFVGSGAAAVAAAVREGRDALAALPDLLPDAGALARIAAGLEASEAPLVPLYLRPPDAKPQVGQAIARA